jgi:hypothetical protein
MQSAIYLACMSLMTSDGSKPVLFHEPTLPETMHNRRANSKAMLSAAACNGVETAKMRLPISVKERLDLGQ